MKKRNITIIFLKEKSEKQKYDKAQKEFFKHLMCIAFQEQSNILLLEKGFCEMGGREVKKLVYELGYDQMQA